MLAPADRSGFQCTMWNYSQYSAPQHSLLLQYGDDYGTCFYLQSSSSRFLLEYIVIVSFSSMRAARCESSSSSAGSVGLDRM